MSKTAIVIGATGLVGRYLVSMLLEDPTYSSVVIYARKTLDIAHPKLMQKPFPDPVNTLGEVKGDDFYCCLGTTIKKAGSQDAFRHIDFEIPLSFAKAARAGGVHHFALVSAVGSDPESRLFYARVKGDLEIAIKRLSFPSFTIVRPWLLLGPRMEFRLGEKIGAVIQGIVNPFLFGKLRDFRSVPARDVAHCLVTAAHNPPRGCQIISSRDIPRLPPT